MTVQVAKVPEHAPPHPEKAYPAAGVCVRVTDVPEEYDAVQVKPQLIPDGTPDTEPPVEELTVSVSITGAGLEPLPEPPPPPPQAAFSKTMATARLRKKTRR